jgi:hypothetical protein
MTPTDPTPPDTLESPEPAPAGRFRRRNVVAGLATVAVLAAAATGVAMASTSTPSPSPSGSTATPGNGTQKGVSPQGGGHFRGPGGMRGGPGGPGGFGGMIGPMGALHGEFTVPKQGGGYQTLVMQRGSVTSVSSGSITVKSQDGFSATYAVSADTLVNAARDGIGSIKKGDDVTLLAQRKSGNDTALQIGDLTKFKGLGDRFGPGRDRGAAPSPAPTGSTGSSSFGV